MLMGLMRAKSLLSTAVTLSMGALSSLIASCGGLTLRNGLSASPISRVTVIALVGSYSTLNKASVVVSPSLSASWGRRISRPSSRRTACSSPSRVLRIVERSASLITSGVWAKRSGVGLA